MSRAFYKQLLFISLGIAILVVGGLAIYSAVPSGGLKVNPILGHDLDLNALYYGQAANNTVHDITTQDISISAWVKVDVDAGNYGVVAGKHRLEGVGYAFYIHGGQLYLYTKDADTDVYYVYSSITTLNDNKWHYVAGIIDRDTGANSKIFIDGVDLSVRSGTVTNIGTLTNSYTFEVSHDGTGTWNSFDGQIRDVKLYYAAGDHWSDSQVLYQAQHPFDYTANAGTLTDYWRLDEGSGTTLYGKVNNLTLSNVLAWTTQPKIKVVNQENTTTTSNNPVGWWKMDEGTGQYAYDVSGNGNTGTLGTSTSAEPADPTWTTGKLGKGLSFDGGNDYVNAGSGASLNITGSITVAGWVKPNIVNAWKRFASRGEYNTGWITGITNTGKADITAYNGSVIAMYGLTTMQVGQWYHIVGVVNSSTQKIYIYLNGVLDNTPLAFVGSIANPNVATLIGSSGNITTYPFNGLIDDVRIYNRALSAGEVAQQYNSTKDGYLGKIKVSTGLVGYWKLDDNQSLTSVIDYSGKGNTGTAYSSTATSTSVLSTSTAMIGRAMSFDGSNNWIDAGVGSSLNSTDALTIEAWIKTTSSGRMSITQKGQNSACHPDKWFFYESDNTLVIRSSTANTLYYIPSSVVNIRDGMWHQVAVVAVNNQRPIFYIDSRNVSISTSIYTKSTNANTYNLIIGRAYWTSWTDYFNGLIDEVKIWNRALSATEIQQDYVRGASHLPY